MAQYVYKHAPRSFKSKLLTVLYIQSMLSSVHVGVFVKLHFDIFLQNQIVHSLLLNY